MRVIVHCSFASRGYFLYRYRFFVVSRGGSNGSRSFCVQGCLPRPFYHSNARSAQRHRVGLFVLLRGDVYVFFWFFRRYTSIVDFRIRASEDRAKAFRGQYGLSTLPNRYGGAFLSFFPFLAYLQGFFPYHLLQVLLSLMEFRRLFLRFYRYLPTRLVRHSI